MNKFVLASASPRRKELLEQIGLSFMICKSSVEEKITESDPARIVMELSEQKAKDVKKDVGSNVVVIGADTIVVFRDQILGKPVDKEDAYRMLFELQGKTHKVYTGVTVCYGNRVRSFFESTKVHVYEMNERQIRSYIETGEPMDKAGAYGIQGRFAAYIRGIEGDYNNVVGLPIGRLYRELVHLSLLE